MKTNTSIVRLNLKKIDKNNKTLLGLRSRSINELKKVPKIESLNCTVSLCSGY